MGGSGNAAAFIAVVKGVTADEAWRGYFDGFLSPYHFYDIEAYSRWLPQCGFTPARIELIPKTMRHDSVEGLRGWFRTTWFPYTDRLPSELRERFINTVINRYLPLYPTDSDGATALAMVRLEVAATAVVQAG